MLKKANKVVGIMVIIVLFIIVGCSEKKTGPKETEYIGGDGNNGAVHLGNQLNLSGQVYLLDFEKVY